MDNGLEDLWRRENPHSPAMISPFARIQDRQISVYTDIKICNNTNINHIMVLFADHYNAISVDRLPSKLKLGKIRGTLIIFLYVNPNSSQLQRLFFFIKNTINNHSSASDWREYTWSDFKENAKIFSKNSTAQENISILGRNLFFYQKHKQNNHSSASDWWRNTKPSFKENARTFSKNSITQANIKTLRLKEDCKTYTKNKTSNEKLNQW